MVQPVDLKKVKTYPIGDRQNKVKIDMFASEIPQNPSVRDLLSSLPSILKANDFKRVVGALKKAKESNGTIIWAMGDAVVKVGLTPIIVQLMDAGYISGIALQGAGIIHDFEIALIGETSEDVAVTIQDGRFGMVEETGRMLNDAIKEGVNNGLGIGEAVGKFIDENNLKHRDKSLVYNAYKRNIPVTVHVAYGTDIIHMHPAADGSAIGKGTEIDFRKFISLVTNLDENGVIVNIASAVILPEVFLKSLSVARNLGNPVKGFTAVNFDMIQHYRPTENVVKRPTQSGGAGYTIIGHIEIMIPLLAASLFSD